MIDIGGSHFACDECACCKLGEQTDDIGQLEYGFCDKIDGEFYAGGYCEDAFIEKIPEEQCGHRKTGRAYRRIMQKEHIQRYRNRCEIIRYNAPRVNMICEDDECIMGTYIKRRKNSHFRTFCKRKANRAVRKRKNLPANGCGYRKHDSFFKRYGW